jgi:hypothetical protein
MAKKKRAGRPKGSKNKSKMTSEINVMETAPKRRGRPAGSSNKGPGRPAGTGKRGRPAGIQSKRTGRPIAGSSIVTPGGATGIHFIGRTLIIDTNEMGVDEVIFLGEGSTPKVR